MSLLTLGDSHALFCYAGVAGARIFWRGPVTMHRAARDGLRSIVPGNCRPKADDVLVLSFGEIDCRVHIPRIASLKQTCTKQETLALCDRFGDAVNSFSKKCPSRLAISCIIPPPKTGLATEFYRDENECFEDAIAIRETMNARLSQIAQLVDFRSSFMDSTGQLNPEMCDGYVHIDSRCSRPVVDALNLAMDTSYALIEPLWPHPFPMAQPPYISPIKRARRKVKHVLLSSFGLGKRP